MNHSDHLAHGEHIKNSWSESLGAGVDRWWLVLLILFGLVFVLGIPG